MTIWLLFAASLAALAAAVVIRMVANRVREDLGFTEAPVCSDCGPNSQVLVSDKYLLTGKPDHLIKVDGTLIPVERKSRQVSDRGPHEGEVLQLAAYCLLVEEHFGTTVHEGILQYPNRSIDVSF